MISLLTHFRRLSEVDLQRLRSSGQQRAARMGLNLLLLAGLWGLVLYLRALALPEPAGARYPRRAILGQWQAAITSSSTIEFTHAGVFRLMREGKIKRTALYRFDERGNIILYALEPILIYNHGQQPGMQFLYAVSFIGDEMSMTATGWRTDEKEGWYQGNFLGLEGRFRRAK